MIPLAVAAVSAIAGAYGASRTNAANQSTAQQQMQYQTLQQQGSEQFNMDQQYRDQLYNASQAQNAMAFDQNEAVQSNNWAQQSQAQAMAYGTQQQAESERFDAQQQTAAQNYDSQQAQIARDYTTQMSNTAYQRSVADMKAAGLNPILGVSSGGASTPSSPSPTVSPASVGMGSVGTPFQSAPHGTAGFSSGAGVGSQSGARATMSDVIGSALSSAYQGAKLSQDIQSAQANIANTQADTANKAASASEIAARTKLLGSQDVTESMRPGAVDAQRLRDIASAGSSQADIPLKQATAGAAAAQAAQSYQSVNTGQAVELGQRLINQRMQQSGDSFVGSNLDTIHKVINGVTQSIMDAFK